MLVKILLAASAAVSEPENANGDLSTWDTDTKIVMQGLEDIQELGALKYCGKTGLRDPLYRKISDHFVELQIEQGLPEGAATRWLLYADLLSSGVQAGLVKARLDAAQRSRVCSAAISQIDKMMEAKGPGH